MIVRSMVGILVEYEDRVLMMHRAPDRKMNPNLWGPPGGHVEPEEMQDPAKAALRELEEETGIRSEQLEDFALAYVVMTASKELHLHYIFSARMKGKPSDSWPETGEGTLHWIAKDAVRGLSLPMTMRHVLPRWVARESSDSHVWLGVHNGEQMHWQSVSPQHLDPAQF